MKNIFHAFLRITAFLQTPRPEPEGSMTGVIKAWTLEQRVSVRYEHCLHTCWLFPRLSHKGTAWGQNKEIWTMSMCLGKDRSEKVLQSAIRSNSWTQSGLCTSVQQRLQVPWPIAPDFVSGSHSRCSPPDLYSNNWRTTWGWSKNENTATQNLGWLRDLWKFPLVSPQAFNQR